MGSHLLITKQSGWRYNLMSSNRCADRKMESGPQLAAARLHSCGVEQKRASSAYGRRSYSTQSYLLHGSEPGRFNVTWSYNQNMTAESMARSCPKLALTELILSRR